MSGDRTGSGQAGPADRLRDALAEQGWGVEELGWLLGLPTELTEHLLWELRISPTLSLRLEAALGIPAQEWFEAVGMPTPDLWLTAEAMEAELVQIRRRRYLLTHRCQHDEGGWAPSP